MARFLRLGQTKEHPFKIRMFSLKSGALIHMSFELKNVKSLYNAQNCLKTGLFHCSYYTGDYEWSIRYRMGPCSLNRHRQKVHSTYCKKYAFFPGVDPINLFFVSTLCEIS